MCEESKEYLFYALTIEGDPKTIRYIGTTTTSIKKRFSQHKYCATHPEKCGLPVHKWIKSVLDSGKTVVPIELTRCYEDKWEETEINLIQEYRDKGFKLLNLDKGGKGVITKEKRDKSSLERSGEAHHKAIVAFTLDGEFYAEYGSLSEAAKAFNKPKVTNICSALRGNTKSAYGYIWKYKKECNVESDKVDEYTVDRHGKKIYHFDLSGKLINTYDAIIDIVKNHNGSYNGIKSAIKNKKIYNNSYLSFTDSIVLDAYEHLYKFKIG